LSKTNAPSFLAIALEKTNQILDQNSTWKAKNVIQFLSSDIVFLFHKAILAGEHFDETFLNELPEKYSLELVEKLSDPTLLANSEWKDADITLVTALSKNLENRYFRPLAALKKYISSNNQQISDGQLGQPINIAKFQSYNIIREVGAVFGLKKSNEIELSHFYTFHINLLLAYTDFNLECNERVVEILDDAIQFLNNVTLDPAVVEIKNKLYDKAEFLKYKIKYRLLLAEKNKDNSGTINFENELPISAGNSFATFVTIINNHYNCSIDEVALKKEVESYTLPNIADIKMAPFYHLNRFYFKSKTFDKSLRSKSNKLLFDKISEIEKIISKNKNPRLRLKTLHTTPISIYEKIAIRSVYKLINNSKLRIELDECREKGFSTRIESLNDYFKNSKIGKSCLEQKFSDVRKQSTDHRHPDFYCCVLFAEYLNSLFDFLIKNPEKIFSIVSTKDEKINLKENADSLIEHIVKVYKDTLAILAKALQKVSTYKVRPISLKLDECFIPCKWTEKMMRAVISLSMDTCFYIQPIYYLLILEVLINTYYPGSGFSLLK
jgi:hypothetical protein